MSRVILFVAALSGALFFSSSARSQYYFYNDDYYDSPVTWELGFSAGGMNCLTDLGGRKGAGGKFIKDVNWNTTRLCAGLYAAFNFQCIAAARLECSLGQISAGDDILKNHQSASYGRYMRNLSFRSGIAEAALLLEFHPLSITGNFVPALSPYLLSGIGYFGFSPRTYINNSWVILADLHTEGQGFSEYKDRKPYKLTQLNMPWGCGIKYEISAVITFRFEIVCRKLWTDYLDDASKSYINQNIFDRYMAPSQAALARKVSDRRLTSDPAYLTDTGNKRGNDKDNDAYFSFSFKTGLVLGRSKRR